MCIIRKGLKYIEVEEKCKVIKKIKSFRIPFNAASILQPTDLQLNLIVTSIIFKYEHCDELYIGIIFEKRGGYELETSVYPFF